MAAMDPVNPASVMRDLLMAVKQFQHNTGQLAYLLRQLEALQQYTGRPIHVRQLLQSCDQLDLMECLTFMVKVVCERESPDLMHKALSILLNVSQCEELKNTLYETFSLTSSLAALVLAHGGVHGDSTLLQSLQLLQHITYGHRVDLYQPHIEDLLAFLVKRVLTSSNGDELVAPVLGSLANLCRNNTLVQSAIKNNFKDRVKKLMKVLCAFFDDDNKMLVISSLSVFVSISVNDPRGQQVFFESENVSHVLAAIFNIIENNFKTTTWKYAADLLTDLLRLSQMKLCITKYHHLAQCINTVLSLLAVGSEDSVSDVFDLLLCLCLVPHIRQLVNRMLFQNLGKLKQSDLTSAPGLKQLTPGVTTPLVSCIHWAGHTSQASQGDSPVAQLALDFMADSVQEVTCCGVEAPHPLQHLVPVFSHMFTSLCAKDSPARASRLVRLLTVLSSHEPSRTALGKTLTCELLHSVLESLLCEGYVSYASATSPLASPHRDRKEEGTLCILLTLNLVAKLQKHISGAAQYLAKTLKEPRVQDFLGLGMTSASQEQVEMSLSLFAISLGVLDARPEVPLCSLVASLNKQRSQRSQPHQQTRRSEDSHHYMDTEPHSKVMCRGSGVLQNKENQCNLPGHPADTSTTSSHSNSTLKMEDLKTDTTVDDLINRMQSTLEPSGVKTVMTAKVMEVFEHHIKQLEVEKEHTNDLLEAKTLALRQADRVIGQLRAQQASHAAEMKKLQGLIKMSEKKEEQRAKECSSLEDRLRQTQQEKTSLANINDDLSKAHEALKELYNTSQTQSQQLEEERKLLSKQLKEKESAYQKLSQNHANLQANLKNCEKERQDLEREKEDLDTALDKARASLNTSAEHCTQLKQKTKTLESMNGELTKELANSKARGEDLERELDKHNQIVNFIKTINGQGGSGAGGAKK